MKRFGRMLFNYVTMLSLALLVASVVLWVRSYWVADEWSYTVRRRPSDRTEQTARIVRLEMGRVSLLYSRLLYDDAWLAGLGFGPIETGTWFRHARGTPRRVTGDSGGPDVLVIRRFLGFEYGVVNPTPRTRDLLQTRWISVPLWLIALCTALPALPAWRKWRRDRRAAALRLCPACGYDLRATPERCPECGSVPEGMPE